MFTDEARRNFAYDPYSAEAMTDPLPLYKVLRDHYPAYWIAKYDAWALSRFQDVWEVGEDNDRFTVVDGPVFESSVLSAYQGTPPAPVTAPMGGFPQLDPPQQTKIRQATGASLRPRSVATLEADMRRLANEQLDKLVPQGRFDLVTEYGGQVSAGVMCLIIGLPLELAPRLLDLVNRSLRRDDGRPGITSAGEAARKEMGELLADYVEQRRKAGADGSSTMVDGLINAEIDGRRLDTAEIVMQVGGILAGGAETVPKVVARGLLELWRRPDQLAEVRSDIAANVYPLFEEVMRYGAPLQWVGRTLRMDSVVAGTSMKAGQRVLLLIASANRDEREFDEPDTFRWNRKIERHFAFGHGLHFCIGVHVARLEGRILLEEFLQRVPTYEIDLTQSQIPPSEFQIGYISMPVNAAL